MGGRERLGSRKEARAKEEERGAANESRRKTAAETDTKTQKLARPKSLPNGKAMS